jgi:voltage-gated potassium channel
MDGIIFLLLNYQSGIGFIGMLTGTISTYFIKSTNAKTSYKVELIENIKAKLDNFDELTFSDIDEIRNVLFALKSSERNEVNA